MISKLLGPAFHPAYITQKVLAFASHVSLRTVRRWAADGTMPPVFNVGRCQRYTALQLQVARVLSSKYLPIPAILAAV